jgi:hypothetical protein
MPAGKWAGGGGGASVLVAGATGKTVTVGE